MKFNNLQNLTWAGSPIRPIVADSDCAAETVRGLDQGLTENSILAAASGQAFRHGMVTLRAGNVDQFDTIRMPAGWRLEARIDHDVRPTRGFAQYPVARPEIDVAQTLAVDRVFGQTGSSICGRDKGDWRRIAACCCSVTSSIASVGAGDLRSPDSLAPPGCAAPCRLSANRQPVALPFATTASPRRWA